MIILIIILLCLQNVLPIVIPDIILKIRDGQIKGQQFLTENDTVYYGFQGIPYAKPPIGDLRFESPQLPEPWTGIFNATEDSKACMSNLNKIHHLNESEDCLYINVYTPSFMPNNDLPVMFWIYGGDFVSGNASKATYGPDYLMEENVILVTFNYRLGPMGFLSTGDAVMPGNYGLKDQNLALQWTKENIKYFGGDPNKITIFGQSAGAASVALHLLSKKSSGLFRAAIIQSASALVPWILNLDPKTYSVKLAKKAGFNGRDSAEMKRFLKGKSAKDIFAAADWLKLTWPVLEVHHEDAFITESNYQLLESGDFNKVPTIIGICSEESLGFLIGPIIAIMEALIFEFQSQLLIPSDLHPNITDKVTIINKIHDMYLTKNKSFYSNVTAYAEFITDNMFARGVLKHAELQQVFNPLYFYQFAYYGRPFIPAFNYGVGKVGHSAEIPFIFKLSNYKWNDKDTHNVLVQQRLVKLWTNFAKYLNPTPDIEDQLLNNINWTRFNPNILNYLNINETLKMEFQLRQEKYLQWKHIYEEYGRKPFVTY